MGLRGPQTRQQIRSNPLDNINPPDWPGAEGVTYWTRHAQQLAENKLLTRETRDSFAILCDAWDRLQSFRGLPTNRAFLDCQKQFVSLACRFRLFPTEKPNVKEDRFTDMGEIPLDLD